MVHSHQLFSPQQATHPRGNGDTLERSAHAGTFGVADARDIRHRDPGFFQRLRHEPRDPYPMVFGRVSGEKAFAGGRHEGVADVGEDSGRSAVGRVLDDADAELVG